MKYRYWVSGTGAESRWWDVTGEVEADLGGFSDAVGKAMSEVFRDLHPAGGVVYGRPGEGGCKGPYTIKKFTIELREPREAMSLNEAFASQFKHCTVCGALTQNANHLCKEHQP
jgi:hypothetical protein